MAGRSSGRLNDAEKKSLEDDGYVLRTNVFDPREITEITTACEALVADLVSDRRGRRYKVGSTART